MAWVFMASPTKHACQILLLANLLVFFFFFFKVISVLLQFAFLLLGLEIEQLLIV